MSKPERKFKHGQKVLYTKAGFMLAGKIGIVTSYTSGKDGYRVAFPGLYGDEREPGFTVKGENLKAAE